MGAREIRALLCGLVRLYFAKKGTRTVTIKEKIRKHLSNCFGERLSVAFRARWGVEVDCPLGAVSMHFITTRKDGEDFTPEQYAWIAAWVQGWEVCSVEALR